MKRQNLIIVILVAFISAIFSIILSGVIFGSPQSHLIKVPEVNKISSEFPSPQNDNNYKKFFNDKAFNPTQLIRIGGSSNSTPFQGGQGQ